MRTHRTVSAVLATVAVILFSACSEQSSPSGPEPVMDTEIGRDIEFAATANSTEPETLAATSCDPYRGIRITSATVLPNGLVRYEVRLVWRDGTTLHRSRAIDAISRSPSQLKVERLYASSFDARWVSGTRATVKLTDNRNTPCLSTSVTLRR